MFDVLGYYKILNCQIDVDEKVLKLSYRDSAKFWHPDHNKAPDALEQFQKISLAYNILSDPQSRLVYDLLSMVYTQKDFPDMKTLKIYKSVGGEETPFLRVFKLIKVYPKLGKARSDEQNLIGTFDDACDFVSNTARHNWLFGWWSIDGFTKNIAALKKNYHRINQNPDDNFKMLIHNAAAFVSEQKMEKAALSMMQAFQYAPADQVEFLKRCQDRCPIVQAQIPVWDYNYLKRIQFRYLKLFIGAVLGTVLVLGGAFFFDLNSETIQEKIKYYQEVRFNNGSETVDDVVVSRVFNIPVDVTDTTMLYHTTDRVKAMYGPSEEFDVLATLRMGQTVRVTGYTPDKEWYRVMLDNGEMGFIRKGYIKSGVGRDIPKDSKIFYNPALER